MEIRPFCVYNKTNESFLSLNVGLAGGYADWLKECVGLDAGNACEGRWITRLSAGRTLGRLKPRDLIYLDSSLTVLAIVEKLPGFRTAPARPDMVSILELPVESAASSGTRVGHQLVICAAEEMESQLRSMPQAEAATSKGGSRGLRERFAEARRATRRVRWPRLVASSATSVRGGMHEVRDISAGGLYLMTEARWPLGTQIRMTLERSDAHAGMEEHNLMPVVVDLRVVRWDDDGMGLEFTQVDAEQTALVATHVR